MSATRREFLQAGSLAIVGGTLPATPVGAVQQTAGRTARDLAAVKALVFDTFGTVVDYRSTIISEGEALGKAKGLTVDWAKFADAWRGAYAPAMDRVRKGELPWTKLDALHRMMLDKVLADFNVKGLTEAEIDNLNRVWHRLKPWPDAVSGLTRLKKKFIIAPLSNGNVSLMTDMAKHAGLPWDLILGAELARHYKPDKEVYLHGGRPPEPQALGNDDGRGAPERPARGPRRGVQDGLRPAPPGRAQRREELHGRSGLRRGGAGLQRAGRGDGGLTHDRRRDRKDRRILLQQRSSRDLRDLCVVRRDSVAEQAPRENAPERVGQPQTIVAGDFSCPELAADNLAVVGHGARQQRLACAPARTVRAPPGPATPCW